MGTNEDKSMWIFGSFIFLGGLSFWQDNPTGIEVQIFMETSTNKNVFLVQAIGQGIRNHKLRGGAEAILPDILFLIHFFN